MFTGLVETTGEVVELTERGESASLVLRAPQIAEEAVLGESVAVNGCCLTVAGLDPAAGTLRFDLLAQTLRVTSLGAAGPGALVNLERALALGARLGGHLVQGHVDTTVRVLDWSERGGDHRLVVELPAGQRHAVIPKGSICLDGISLTAAEVTPESVTCWIIPHTLERTHLRQMSAGRRMNVEFDMIGKFVAQYLSASGLAVGA
jgi:riboflavin synthase